MFEHERRDIDTDIEFDFFDDGPTSESPSHAATEVRPRRRRRIPRRPPGRGDGHPLLRLVLLIAAGILLAVVLVFAVKSCRDGAERGAYEGYMQGASGVAADSQRIGKELASLITTPGIQLSDLDARLNGLRQREAQVTARAQELDPPGALREQQESLVEALQLRVSGLAGLAEAFAQVKTAKDAQTSGRELAEQAQRLVASDVVYEDVFEEGTRRVLEREGIEGVAVPVSEFVTDPELGSPRAWTLIVRRLTQKPASGGLHGNGIESVRVQPGGQVLSPTDENTVTASDRLEFQVRVENSGDSQETQVPVRLTIVQSPEPVRKTEIIPAIDPGETKVVRFRDLGPPAFGTRVTVRVAVEPVAGEKNTSNNTAEYAVVFTLG